MTILQLNIFNQNNRLYEYISEASNDKNIDPNLLEINKLDTELEIYFRKKIVIDNNLNRKIVSFQGNKDKAQYRWFKYKEAFSSDLVEYLLHLQDNLSIKKVFDPFAGIGTTLFACSKLGIDSDGIELLPIGKEVIEVRQLLNDFNENDFSRLAFWKDKLPWKQAKKKELNQLTITKGAYPLENKESIEKYLYQLDFENSTLKKVLLFALMSILESISYTRKDGQYLRWDKRANRKNGSKKFCKGNILDFDIAIVEQIEKILLDSCPLYRNDLFKSKPLQKNSIGVKTASINY